MDQFGRKFDTSMGGGQAAFPETTWGLVSRLRDSDPASRNAGIEKLCTRYWKPVYQYVRIAWARTNDDAKDLTQAFFVWLFEGEVLAKYAPERGGFRGYLKGLLRNFIADQDKAVRRLKRGGGVKRIPLDDDFASLQDVLADPRAADPEKAFDLAWKKELLDTALTRVRERHAAGDRAIQFRVFEEYDLSASGASPTYAEVAERLGIKESDVRNHLFAVRERLRSEIQAEISETVADLGELQEEWGALFGS